MNSSSLDTNRIHNTAEELRIEKMASSPAPTDVFSFLKDEQSRPSPGLRQDAELLVKESRMLRLRQAIDRLKV